MGTYFIKFEDANDLRRRILESSKAGLHLLKGYQELQRVRGEKLTHMYALRQQLRELNLLINRAESMLPTLTEQDLALVHQHKEAIVVQEKKKLKGKQKMQKPVKQPEKPKPRTQEERIAASLAEIERRLGTLDQK